MKEIVEEVVVFREIGEVVVAALVDDVELAVLGDDTEEHFALVDGDEAVFVAVEDEDGAADFFDELVRADLVAEEPFDGEDKCVALDLVEKAVIGRIQDEEARVVPGSDAGGDAAAQGATVHDDLRFIVLGAEPFVDVLGVVVKDGFGAAASAFAKASIVDDEEVVAFADKVSGEFAPALDAARIPLEVENDALGIGDFEM